MRGCLISLLLIGVIGTSAISAQQITVAVPFTSGPVGSTAANTFIGTSNGLYVYPAALNSAPTIFNEGEVVALGINTVENRVFYCYRDLTAQSAKCVIRSSTTPFAPVATSANLMSGSAPTFTSSLSYNELIKSRVNIEPPSTNQPLTYRYRLGVPVRAVNGTVKTWVGFVITTGSMLTTLASMVLSPNAKQPEVVSFAAAVYLPTTRYSFTVLTRRNVTTSTGAILDTASFLVRVCSEDVGANGAYPALLNNYGTYTEMTIPLENNAGTAGYYGNMVVDSHFVSKGLYMLWSASRQAPASVTQVVPETRGTFFNAYGATCNSGRTTPTTLIYAGYFQHPPAITQCTRPSSDRFSIFTDTSTSNTCTDGGSLFVPISAVGTAAGGSIRLRVTNPGDYKFISLLAVTRMLSTAAAPTGVSTDIMLLGTTAGEIVKAMGVLSSTANMFQIFEVRQIDGMRRPITRLLEIPGSNDILATASDVSTTQIIRFSPTDCEGLSSCSDCVNQGKNSIVQLAAHPYCRWCVYSGKCMDTSSCNTASRPQGLAVAFVDTQQSCPRVTQISPPRIPIRTQQNITVTATNLPVLTSWSCRYPDFDKNLNFAATVSVSNGIATFRCNSPTLTMGTVASRLAAVALHSTSLNVTLLVSQDLKLDLFDCNFFARCETCAEDVYGCGWCSLDNTCRLPRDSCTSQVTTCPRLTSITPTHASVDQMITLQLTGTGLPTMTGATYQCLIASEDLSLNMTRTATIQPGAYNCGTFQVQRTFITDTTLGIATLFVSPVYNGYIVQRLGLTVNLTAYNCPAIGAAGCNTCLQRPMFDDCYFCSPSQGCSGTMCIAGQAAVQRCDSPSILSVIPSVGPSQGGTSIFIQGVNFGISLANIDAIMIGTRLCTMLRNYTTSLSITCTTPPFPLVAATIDISMTIRGFTSRILANFTVRPVSVISAGPLRSPQEGGVTIIILGNNLDVGDLLTVIVQTTAGMLNCPLSHRNRTSATCVTPVSNVTDANALLVMTVDGFISTRNFMYAPNPVVSMNNASRTRSISVGGLIINIPGTSLLGPDSYLATFVPTTGGMNVTETCTATSETNLRCLLPAYPSGTIVNINLALGLSSFANVAAVAYEGVPSFEMGVYELTPSVIQTIVINGTDVLIGGLTASDYVVTVGNRPCTQLFAFPDSIQCRPPDNPPDGASMNSTYPIHLTVGNLVVKAGTAHYSAADNSGSDINVAYIAGPVGGVVFLLIVAIIIFFVVSKKNQKRHTKEMDMLLHQMDSIEANVASECKTAFAELQTNLGDMGITEETSFQDLPFWSFDDYATKLLFPQGGGNRNSLMPLTSKLTLNIEKMAQLRDTLKRFEQRLLLDKKFLVPFIRTLETQSKFHMTDRVFVASLLMVAFQDNLYYATEILKLLLTELIRRSSGRNPKLLLRRTESVAEKLLTNWLSYCLHDYIKSEVGTPLFRLYHAMKKHIENGPVDAVTGEARNCLSEERLLRDKIDCQVLQCFAVADLKCMDQKYQVQLLTCDSISQAKEKVLDAMYRTSPVSHRPAFESIDLALVSPNGTSTIQFRDLDQTSLVAGDYQQINTIGFYKVQNGSTFCVTSRGHATLMRARDQTSVLFPKQGADPQRHVSEDGNKIWHLVKPAETTGEQHANGGRASAKLVSEIYLTRLLSAKKTLQTYVDALFHVVFCSENGKVPAAIKYLFDFIDQQATEMNLTDPDVVQTWKNNSVPLRFWINVIKNPEFVLDINKTATVDNCLSVVAQAFMDSCSVSDMRLSKDSPSTKLLYAKEVKEIYRSKILSYYSDIRGMSPISEQEMERMLREASQAHLHSDVLAKEAAVYELFNYAVQYADDISDTLEEEHRTGLVKVFEGLINDAPDIPSQSGGHLSHQV